MNPKPATSRLLSYRNFVVRWKPHKGKTLGDLADDLKALTDLQQRAFTAPTLLRRAIGVAVQIASMNPTQAAAAPVMPARCRPKVDYLREQMKAHGAAALSSRGWTADEANLVMEAAIGGAR